MENNIICQEDKELLNKAIENMPSLESQLDPKYLLQLEFKKNPEPYKPEYNKYILNYYESSCWEKPFFGAYRSYFEDHAFDICYKYGLGEVCRNI